MGCFPLPPAVLLCVLCISLPYPYHLSKASPAPVLWLKRKVSALLTLVTGTRCSQQISVTAKERGKNKMRNDNLLEDVFLGAEEYRSSLQERFKIYAHYN